MCVVSIKIDEVALRDMRPDLDSTAAICSWVQELVNQHIHQMDLNRDMTPEELYTVIMEDAKAIYADDSI